MNTCASKSKFRAAEVLSDWLASDTLKEGVECSLVNGLPWLATGKP